MTDEEKKLYHEAIDKALFPKQCQYVVNDTPACVAAQYLAMKGVPVQVLKALGGKSISCDPENGRPTLREGEVEAFHEVYKHVPKRECMGLLNRLQGLWDSSDPNYDDEEVRKAQMHRAVEEYYRGY